MAIAKLANPFSRTVPIAVMGLGCYYHRREPPRPGPRDAQAHTSPGEDLQYCIEDHENLPTVNLGVWNAGHGLAKSTAFGSSLPVESS